MGATCRSAGRTELDHSRPDRHLRGLRGPHLRGGLVTRATLPLMIVAAGVSCALSNGRATVGGEPPEPAEVTQPAVERQPQGQVPSPTSRLVSPESAARAARPAGQQRQPLPPLPVVQLDETSRQDLDAITRSFLFTEELPIRDLLMRLVRDTDLSVVPDPDVEGTFVGELKNVTLRQALDLVLRPRELDYSVQGSFIRVFKRRMETRIFAVDYVPTRRVARRELTANATGPGGDLALVPPGGSASRAAAGPPVDGSWTQIAASEDGDLFRELAVGVRMLLSEQGKFNLDRKAALLQVTDLPDRLEKVAFYLDAVQTRVQRQVQIQALVIEVGLRDEFTSGIDWPALLRDMGASAGAEAAPTPTDGLALDLRVSNVDDLLRALSNQGTVTVVSNPRVVAMNSEPVVMRVGTRDIFFVTTSQMDTAGRVVQTTLTPQAVTEGLVLTVTPQISAGGIINMSINPSVTARTGEVTSRLGDTVPIVSVRETDTMVRVRQGETVVIAGLMLESRSRSRSRPGSLPPAEPPSGTRFRSSRPAARVPESGWQPSKTDLIILLTPTVVTPRARGATQG